ncbi:MAG: S1 RNA-binding domain-containing protein [Planctomycetota bacterium]
MSIDPHELEEAELNREIAAQVGDLMAQDLDRRMAAAVPHTPEADARGRIAGRVITITGQDVFVDIGAKSEGVLPLDEFPPDEPPQVGQVYELVPQGFDRDSGLMRLSLREAKVQADLSSLQVGDVVKGRVTGSNIGGLELRVQGLRGFMPMSQVDLVRHDDFAHFMGHWFEAEVTEIDRRGKRLVLSRRRVLERERAEERQQLRFQLAEGQVRKGVVRRLADFGAFVDIGGIDGLLHVSDMSWSRVNHPGDMLKEGAEIEVKVLKVDLVKDRVSLGLKQLSADPWSLVEGRYRVGDTLDGKVTKLMDFGAFVELEPGVEGLIPISELSWTQRIHHPKDVLTVGDNVRVAVLNVSAEKRKLSLSLKALGQDPWQGITERYQPEAVVSGRIVRTTNFGAFVQLEEGVEGLVHISQLSEQRVRAVQDVAEIGKVVQVRVLSVDPAQRRISLSMKGISGPEAGAPVAESPQPAAAPPRKKERKKPLRGGLSW